MLNALKVVYINTTSYKVTIQKRVKNAECIWGLMNVKKNKCKRKVIMNTRTFLINND